MTVVHCKRSDFDVYIGRPSDDRPMHFGNPFTNRLGTKASHIVADPISAFEGWLRGNDWQDVEPDRRAWILERLPTLRGKVLGCWCVPNSCHGDVLEMMAQEVVPEPESADLVVACWHPETDEDYALCKERAHNWTVDGLRLPEYPWNRDPRETMQPPVELRGRSKSKVEWS